MLYKENAAALAARPVPGLAAPLPVPGQHVLGLEHGRDALLYVPPGLPGDRPVPLVVSLHGAGGAAAGGLAILSAVADEHKVVLLAPSSRASTWDAVRGTYAADAAAIDSALEQVFGSVPVDPARIGIAGFSDGASYALGLGLANGSLFSKVIAFSPGFIPPAPRAGKPRIFLSHGEADEVLPIGVTSQRIVPALLRDGYGVAYRQFSGGHRVPADIAEEAVEWFLGPAGT
jgi:phospholipase/carboxylesterase